MMNQRLHGNNSTSNNPSALFATNPQASLVAQLEILKKQKSKLTVGDYEKIFNDDDANIEGIRARISMLIAADKEAMNKAISVKKIGIDAAKGAAQGAAYMVTIVLLSKLFFSPAFVDKEHQDILNGAINNIGKLSVGSATIAAMYNAGSTLFSEWTSQGKIGDTQKLLEEVDATLEAIHRSCQTLNLDVNDQIGKALQLVPKAPAHNFNL